MFGTIYTPLSVSEFDLDLHEINREKAANITGCKKLPEVKFFATSLEQMILFHIVENGFKVTVKIDDHGVATKCFTSSQIYSRLFPACRYWR